MKPNGNAPGSPFNFDVIPAWLFPSLWDETKEIRLRGLWFVVLYTLSLLIFFGVIALLLAVVFSKPVAVMARVWLFLGIPGGIIYGLATWWDFIRLCKKNILEEARKKSEAQSQEPSAE